MRRSSCTVGAVTLMAWLVCGCGPRAGTVRVSDAWARATPPTATMGAVYLRLTSGSDDRLLGAGVPDTVAARAELHEVVRDTLGRMGMQPVDGVALPAGRTVRFAPGGRHVMLVDLPRPLSPGERIAVRLRFEHATPETVIAVVRGP